MHCTCELVKYKQSIRRENYEQTKALIKAEAPTRHAHSRATSADSIPPHSL